MWWKETRELHNQAAIGPLPTQDRWLTAAEAAAYLGVAVLTLSKWRAFGKGPRYSAALGRDPRYLFSDLQNFMVSKMASNCREARTLRQAVTQPTFASAGRSRHR